MNTITTQIFYQHFLSGLYSNLQAELTDSDQISSNKKINRPSDDPSAMWKIVDYQTQLSQIGQYQQAITAAKSPVQTMDTSLSDLANTLNRANDLAVSAGDGTKDANGRLMISQEVQQLFSTAVSTANTQVDGRYIFAGFQSDKNPIDPTTGEFISDTNSFNVGIADGINVTTNVSAGSLFSFKRVNTTDSATAILPAYNWTNNGANTIPDADPVSALETASGSFVHSSDVFTANGGAVTIKVGSSTSTSNGGFVINNTNNAIVIDGTTYNLTNGIYTGSALATALSGLNGGNSIKVAYQSTNHKFNITSTGGTTVNFGNAATKMAQILGFNTADKTIGSGITSDYAIGDVNLAANSTLQDARDAINTAFNGVTGGSVKAQVVNMGSSSSPDYRLVVSGGTSTIPAGSSGQIDISVLSNPTTTGVQDTNGPPPVGTRMLSYDKATGMNMTLGADKITNYNYIQQATANDSIVIDDGTIGGVANNKVVFQQDGGGNLTATIARGTYTESQLATALASALNNAGGVANYTASYDANAMKFTINNPTHTIKYLWSNAGSTATQVLGNNATDSPTYGANSPATSNNPVLDNFYSFNNNYLNDGNILRALNFEKETLNNNDVGRVSQSLKYLGDLSDTVSQTQAVIGARENQISMEATFQTTSSTNTQAFLSGVQDTDIAKVSSDLAQRTATLSALRTVSSKILSESLFDFLKF